MSENYNPYEVIKVIREQGRVKDTCSFLVGTVISEAPFIVEAKKLQFDRADLLISDRFISNDGLISLEVGETVILLCDSNYSTNVLIERVR